MKKFALLLMVGSNSKNSWSSMKELMVWSKFSRSNILLTKAKENVSSLKYLSIVS
jgi:hypothetical protein